eukprot:g9678.t1
MNENYPSAAEVDEFCTNILSKAMRAEIVVTPENVPNFSSFNIAGVRNVKPTRYIKFIVKDLPNISSFYCIWQPSYSQNQPLLVHTPGYAGTMSVHPGLQEAGYNVLEVNPLGLNTPRGIDTSKLRKLSENVLVELEEKFKKDPTNLISTLYKNVRDTGVPPVLLDTIDSFGEKGYTNWLLCCCIAVIWAKKQKSVDPKRIGFFGTSQGGGGSLLLSSIFATDVKCCAADQPFLTDFVNAVKMTDASHPITAEFKYVMDSGNAFKNKKNDLGKAWRALGFIDTLSHAHRLDIPVLLTSGSNDFTCPPICIFNLYQKLPSTKSITDESNRGHGGHSSFHNLALAWFRTYL